MLTGIAHHKRILFRWLFSIPKLAFSLQEADIYTAVIVMTDVIIIRILDYLIINISVMPQVTCKHHIKLDLGVHNFFNCRSNLEYIHTSKNR
jgi:hypothetical protein